MTPYKTETIEQHGHTYRIEWHYDHDTGAPWEHSDAHGIVSDWTTRDKRPGELILNTSGRSRRYYDFSETVKIARADKWNTAPYDWKTAGEQAAAAAKSDYEYLRRWCNDQWYYCGIKVTMLDEDGQELTSASLWGIEDDGVCSKGHHATIIQDLIGDCEYQHGRTLYPVTECGV